MKRGACLALALLLVTLAVRAQDLSVKVVALFTDKALLEVDGKQKIVSKGETFEGVLLQSATGRGAVVLIEGETMTLELNQAIAGNFKKRKSTSLRIAANAQGMYYTRGTINGHATSFLVDTGASHVTLSGNKATALDIDYRSGSRGMAQTAASMVPVWHVRLDSVSVGGIELNNIIATVIAGSQPADVLLGNSFLQHTEIQKAGSILEITRRH